MKRYLYILLVAMALSSCMGGNENTPAEQPTTEATQQVDEQAIRDSVESALKDSIAKVEAEKKQKAKAEAAEAAAVKKKMRPAYYKVTGTAEVYSGPGEDNSVKRTFKSGTVVQLERVSGVWCKVMYGQDGPSGWVHYKNLKFYMPFEEYD